MKNIYEDGLKWINYVVTAAFIGGTAVILKLCFISEMDIDLIAFIMIIYAAISNATIIVMDKHIGTFDDADINKVKQKMEGIKKQTADTLDVMDNTEMKDNITAKRKGMSIREYKLDKYGDADYDYGVAAKAQAERMKFLEEKRREMAKLQAEIDIESGMLESEKKTDVEELVIPIEKLPEHIVEALKTAPEIITPTIEETKTE